MGYYASGYGTITIRTDYDTPTLQKLYNSKTLDFRDGSKELQAETFLDLIWIMMKHLRPSLILKSTRPQWI